MQHTLSRHWLHSLAIAVLLALAGMANAAAPLPPPGALSRGNALKLIRSQGRKLAIIDVRTPAECEAGHLDDALNIDFNAPDFKGQIGKLDRDGSYVVYCKSGNRSGQAKAVMDQMGFTDVYDGGAYSDLR